MRIQNFCESHMMSQRLCIHTSLFCDEELSDSRERQCFLTSCDRASRDAIPAPAPAPARQTARFCMARTVSDRCRSMRRRQRKRQTSSAFPFELVHLLDLSSPIENNNLEEHHIAAESITSFKIHKERPRTFSRFSDYL